MNIYIIALKKVAYFAGGCFWCTEAIYQNIKGVEEVISGYIGGSIKNPSYREVCSGRTGHAEAVRVVYDQTLVSFNLLVAIFFSTHDPTTLNRQGADVGTQYRSAIFYTSENQRKIIDQVIKELTQQSIFDAPIVTEINAEMPFYTAEKEHNNYFNNNREQPYCQAVIEPKINKFIETYKARLK